MNNEKTHKEGVSRTYKGFDGFGYRYHHPTNYGSEGLDDSRIAFVKFNQDIDITRLL